MVVGGRRESATCFLTALQRVEITTRVSLLGAAVSGARRQRVARGFVSEWLVVEVIILSTLRSSRPPSIVIGKSASTGSALEASSRAFVFSFANCPVVQLKVWVVGGVEPCIVFAFVSALGACAFRIDGFLPFLSFEKSCRERREMCGLLDHQAAFFLSTVFDTPGEEEAMADVFSFLATDPFRGSTSGRDGSSGGLLQPGAYSGSGSGASSVRKGLQGALRWSVANTGQGQEEEKSQVSQDTLQAREEKVDRLFQAFSKFYAFCYESDHKTIAVLNAVHASRVGGAADKSSLGPVPVTRSGTGRVRSSLFARLAHVYFLFQAVS